MRKYIFIISFVLFGVIACDTNEVYEKELYKKVVAFICSDNYNVLEDVQELTGQENETFIGLSCGGTDAPAVDIRVSIVEDIVPFNNYNVGMFDTDKSQYAKLLSKDHYDIEDYHVTIPKGKRTGRLDIKVKPDGLSPDSVYFIPLSISAMSAYEVNYEKSTMLYRVLIKNFYAEQKSSSYTYYTMRGYKDEAVMQATKEVQPINKNTVRLMPGNTSFLAEEDYIAENAILVEVQSDNSVRISGYKDLEVVQNDDDPDFPNVFLTEEDDWGRKFKVFFLAYQYKDGDNFIDIKEELRLQYTDE